MSNPNFGLMNGYAHEELARSAWSNIVGNDKLTIYEIRINAFGLKPAELPVAWVILPTEIPLPK